MKSGTKNYMAACLIFILGFTYQFKYIGEFPSHIHAWAQTDHYAMALGFQNNGFNFFKPETFVYNHQFPNDFQIPAEQTTTAADFPIHDFIPAILMKILGNDPLVFRLYVLLYSFLGLYFLYKLAQIITGNFIKSLMVLFFAGTSPVFIYYQGGFLPSIPSLANAIIGIYFYIIYLRKNNSKDFSKSLFFLTLAALARSTFSIPLLSILGTEFIRILKKESSFLPKLVPVFFSASVFGFYLWYNSYLRTVYGSVFLNHLMPPDDIDEAKTLITQIKDNWKYQYISKYHYLFFALVFISGTILFLKKKIKPENKTGYFLLLNSAILCGTLLFFYAMMKQFPAHDYYFIDTFYLPMVLFFMLFISWIEFENRIIKIISLVSATVLLYGMVLYPLETQEKRRETGSWDKIGISIENFRDSERFLDSMNVSDDAKILVLDPGAPNIPFIFMKRKGMVVLTTGIENIKQALQWNYDYIVVQNEFFVSDIYSNYPEILNHLEKIGDNGKISLCQYSKIEIKQDLTQFLDLKNQNPELIVRCDFEQEENSQWQNVIRNDSVFHSGKYAGVMNESTEFGLTYKSSEIKSLSQKNGIVLFTGWFYLHSDTDFELVVSISGKNEKLYYKGQKLKNMIGPLNQWKKITLTFHLPKINEDEYEFGIYLYNPEKANVYYDDYSFSIY